MAEKRDTSYRFPKSRSKRLPKAVKLARSLSGFEENSEEFLVRPTAEEVGGEAFTELVKISGKWKGAAFLIGEAEVSEEEFQQAVTPVEQPSSTEEEPQPETEKPEAAPAEKPPVAEQATEPEEPEEPEQPAPEEEPEVAPEEESPEEAAEHEPAKAAAPSKKEEAPAARAEEGKSDGKPFCCCWVPPSLAGIIGLALSQFL